MVSFQRRVAVSEFQVVPRSDNGGYGPSSIQLVLNVTNAIPASGIPASGSNVFAGAMAATSPLDVKLSQPVYATNAVLVITGSYDRGSTNAPRNTQVVELTLFERALPGTFGDWAVRRFNDAQLADESISGPFADGDSDGAVNLLEFVTGSDPLVADPANFKLAISPAPASQFGFRFRERKNLADVLRQFVSSSNLTSWNSTMPISVVPVLDFGETQLLEATFTASPGRNFFRIQYGQ